MTILYLRFSLIMPSNANQSDYFGGQAELTPPQSTPTSAHEEKAPILLSFNLPPSPEDSDSNDARRQVLIFSGMYLSPPLTDCTDFDGTIMLGDTGHVLFDAHGCGEDRRKELDAALEMPLSRCGVVLMSLSTMASKL